jgi:ring-1,2-phenylacetyl-CoA epoxidase subunit PaaC
MASYATRLGDDGLILAQRLGAWCGHGPTTEVDLSLANVALDLLGQATYFLGFAAEIKADGRDADALAFLRDAPEFTNCLLVEQPNGDFAQTIARQFLFSTYQRLHFEALAAGPGGSLRDIAQKAAKETAYHVSLAHSWVVRLGDGTEESHARMAAGLDWMWRFQDELFQNDALDSGLMAKGIATDKTALRLAWDGEINRTLARADLPRPAETRGQTGGRQGRHGEHLGHILSEMQFLQRAYPGAKW